VIQLKRKLKAIQDNNKLKNRIKEGMFCFFRQEADITIVIEEPFTFEQVWHPKDKS
jgi:hypothetical protein